VPSAVKLLAGVLVDGTWNVPTTLVDGTWNVPTTLVDGTWNVPATLVDGTWNVPTTLSFVGFGVTVRDVSTVRLIRKYD
jgi:hypothetical protein